MDSYLSRKRSSWICNGKTFYDKIYIEEKKKNARSDIAKVAKSSGLSEEDVAIFSKNHLFIDSHNLEKGYVRFAPSPEIALA